MKPYYQEDGITILHGDCLRLMPEMEEKSLDAIIADLPYGTTQCKWDSPIQFQSLWVNYARLIKPNSAIVLTSAQPFTSSLVMSNPDWFKWEDIWEKSRPTGHLDANRRPMRKHENILVFSEGQPKFNPQMTTGNPNHVSERARIKGHGTYGKAGAVVEQKTEQKFPVSVVRFDSVSPTGRLHNTQKPLGLMEYLIRTYTNEGDLILDNSMGSGTTLVAAKKLRRRAIGIDIEECCCDIAANRLAQGVLQFGGVA